MNNKPKQHFIDMKKGDVFGHSCGEYSDYYIKDHYKFLVDVSAKTLQLIYDSIIDHKISFTPGNSFFGDEEIGLNSYDLLFKKLLEYKIIEKFTVFDFWEDNNSLQVSPQ